MTMESSGVVRTGRNAGTPDSHRHYDECVSAAPSVIDPEVGAVVWRNYV